MEISSRNVTGTCKGMCPEGEILMRETEGLLHQFEAQSSGPGSERKTACLKADPSKVVKQFSRPAAGRADVEPSDLRPAPVLKQTVAYLFDSIVPREHPAWSSVYEFVFDRLRAVRQDMVIQGIMGDSAIDLLEQIVRFHLYASYRLKDASVSDFDPVINKQHLLECLKRLLYLYQVTPGHHQKRLEFECVYLLNNLGDRHALTHFLELKADLRKHQRLQKCYEISKDFLLRNYHRALLLIFQLDCAICLCAVNPHLDTLRINYLQTLAAGYSVKNCRFPVSKLTQYLHLRTEEDTANLCSRCGLVDQFDDTSAVEFVCFNRSSFCQPKEQQAPSSLPALDRLLQQIHLPSLLLGTTPEVTRLPRGVKSSQVIGRGRGRGRHKQNNQ